MKSNDIKVKIHIHINRIIDFEKIKNKFPDRIAGAKIELTYDNNIAYEFMCIPDDPLYCTHNLEAEELIKLIPRVNKILESFCGKL